MNDNKLETLDEEIYENPNLIDKLFIENESSNLGILLTLINVLISIITIILHISDQLNKQILFVIHSLTILATITMILIFKGEYIDIKILMLYYVFGFITIYSLSKIKEINIVIYVIFILLVLWYIFVILSAVNYDQSYINWIFFVLSATYTFLIYIFINYYEVIIKEQVDQNND